MVPKRKGGLEEWGLVRRRSSTPDRLGNSSLVGGENIEEIHCLNSKSQTCLQELLSKQYFYDVRKMLVLLVH